MAVHSSQQLASRLERGVLVLTINETHLRGYSVSKVLKHELLKAIEQEQAPRVVVDFKSVLSLSSEAFRPLLSARRHVEEKGGRLVLCNLAPVVAESFASTRLVGTARATGSAFDVQPDVAAAIASLDENCA